MIPSDRDLALLCAASYDDASPVAWTRVWRIDGAWAMLLRRPGVAIVVFRGTKTGIDVLEDLASIVPVWAGRKLGHCGRGFLAGADAIGPTINAELARHPEDAVILAGHSLGGAHAAIYAGRRIELGLPVAALVTLGEPRPGFERLQELLSAVPHRAAYWNKGEGFSDPVFAVPMEFPFDPFCHSSPVPSIVSARPAANDDWGIAAPHHATLYAKGMAA